MHLGIDLGTSNSAIAGIDKSDIKLFKTAEGTDVLPSAIYINKGGQKFIGNRAYQQAFLAPDNVAQGFKRLMGTSSPMTYAAAGIQTTPEECSAEILRTLLGQVRTEGGVGEFDGVVVTIPAAFNQMQSEATIRAARSAGLDRVGLLQEPIAAAMAAMAQAKNKNAQFLVYDIGGGTFDVALVQSMNGSVTIVAHEGINMLGGRDFDRLLVNAFVRPRLIETFALPDNFQTDPKYRRLLGMARMAAERAKIDLSTNATATIFASDEEVRTTDDDGQDLHLSVEITRDQLESLIADQIGDSIELCRKVLKDNHYSHEDIDRIVLIGGPSKMPCIRDRVPRELGIPADLQTDPMTAVAIGAAIFAESRDWGEAATTRKTSRGSARVEGPVELRYDFPARTSADRARVRVRAGAGVTDVGYRLQIDSSAGWTSGITDVTPELSLEVPIASQGENTFRVTVYDSSGAVVPDATTEFTIVRTHSSAAGIPATQTIAVKIVDDSAGVERNVLAPLVPKGTILPAKGTQKFRSARDLRGGQPGFVDLELYQMADGVRDPELNLFVGAFRINGHEDLEPGEALRKGDEIIVHWEMDDNGLIDCAIEIPSLSRAFNTGKYYSQVGQQDFTGEDGQALAESVVEQAEQELAEAEATMGRAMNPDMDALKRRVEDQRDALAQSDEADTRRSVTEAARAVRQAVSRLRDAPQHRLAVLSRDLRGIKSGFDSDIRKDADPRVADRFDVLSETAERALRDGDFNNAERTIAQMHVIAQGELWKQSHFVVYIYKELSSERHLAADKRRHDSLVGEGETAIAKNDIDALRRIVQAMIGNRFNIGGGNRAIAQLASLLGA